MKILFLDDNKYRHQIFQQNIGVNIVDHVYTADDALLSLRNNVYDVIFLDHDLDERTNNILVEDEQDGRYVCREMIKLPIDRSTPVIIHSLNYTGAMSMIDTLVENKFNDVRWIPFAWRKIRITSNGYGFVDDNEVISKDC